MRPLSYAVDVLVTVDYRPFPWFCLLVGRIHSPNADCNIQPTQCLKITHRSQTTSTNYCTYLQTHTVGLPSRTCSTPRTVLFRFKTSQTRSVPTVTATQHSSGSNYTTRRSPDWQILASLSTIQPIIQYGITATPNWNRS